MRSATPSMAWRSGGSPPPRSLCHKVNEPCGSQSISRTGRDGRCAWAARCAVSVLLPEPPLRDAKTMTFMRAPLSDSHDQGTTAGAPALWLVVGVGCEFRPFWCGKIRQNCLVGPPQESASPDLQESKRERNRIEG